MSERSYGDELFEEFVGFGMSVCELLIESCKDL